jgi:hypothetical protein
MQRSSTECDSHPVISFPDDAACKLQTIILDDQVEVFCKGENVDRIGKLDRCAGCRDVAHDAGIFVAAVLSDSSLIDSMARGDPGFDHDEMSSKQRRLGCHAVVNFPPWTEPK